MSDEINSPRRSPRLSSLKRRRPSYFDEFDVESNFTRRSTAVLKDTQPETILAAVEMLSSNNNTKSNAIEDFFPEKPRRRRRPRKKSKKKAVPQPAKPYRPKSQYVKRPRPPSTMTLETHFQIVSQALTAPNESNIGRIVLWKLLGKEYSYTAISKDRAKAYFPDSKESMSFQTALDGPHSEIPRFESTQLKEDEKSQLKMILFTGGTVECISWAKSRQEHEETVHIQQYIAVGVHQKINPVHMSGSQESKPNMIQIWRIQGLATPWVETEIPLASELSFGICHSYGCVFHLEWCPMTSTWESDSLWNQVNGCKSLGLLAGCFGDGTVRVFNVPHPDSIKETATDGRKYIQLKPILSFEIENANFTRIRWRVTDTGVFILCGSSSGYVSLWYAAHDIGSDALHYVDQERGMITPTYCVRAHTKPIMDIGWHPNPYLYLTAPLQPPLKLWDIRDPLVPINSLNHIYKTTAVAYWKANSPHLIASSSNCSLLMASDFIGSSGRSHYAHQAPIWDLSVSEYLAHVVTCSEDGSVNVTKLHENSTVKTKAPLPTTQLVDIDQQENSSLILRFPNESIEVRKTDIAKIDSFTDQIIGWKSSQWCPNELSCNWIACGSNMGIVCLVPFTNPVPIKLKRR